MIIHIGLYHMILSLILAYNYLVLITEYILMTRKYRATVDKCINIVYIYNE